MQKQRTCDYFGFVTTLYFTWAFEIWCLQVTEIPWLFDQQLSEVTQEELCITAQFCCLSVIEQTLCLDCWLLAHSPDLSYWQECMAPVGWLKTAFWQKSLAKCRVTWCRQSMFLFSGLCWNCWCQGCHSPYGTNDTRSRWEVTSFGEVFYEVARQAGSGVWQ